jgi:hypothetical protein
MVFDRRVTKCALILKGVDIMGDKNPKNIDKLKGQAEDKKEEAIEYKHETPAEKVQNKEREEAIKETKIDAEYGEESDLPQPLSP